MPFAKCRTGKILAIHRIQDGVLFPNGMKMPERNSSGRIAALTMAGDGVSVRDHRGDREPERAERGRRRPAA